MDEIYKKFTINNILKTEKLDLNILMSVMKVSIEDADWNIGLTEKRIEETYDKYQKEHSIQTKMIHSLVLDFLESQVEIDKDHRLKLKRYVCFLKKYLKDNG